MTPRSDTSTRIPVPIVSWQAVVGANAPTVSATRQRYLTMRKDNRTTAGVRVQLRSGNRAQGSSTVHSVLSVLAAYARRAGDDELSLRLLQQGTDLEHRYGALVKAEGGRETASREEHERMLAVTMKSLASSGDWSRLVFAEARIELIEGEFATLIGTRPDGSAVHIDIPRTIIERWDLDEGDDVYVFQNVSGASAIVEILPAARSAEAEREREVFERSLHPVRSEEDVERLRSLAASGALGRRVVRRP